MNTAVTYVGGELDRQRGLDFILVEFRFVLLILTVYLVCYKNSRSIKFANQCQLVCIGVIDRKTQKAPVLVPFFSIGSGRMNPVSASNLDSLPTLAPSNYKSSIFKKKKSTQKTTSYRLCHA